MKIHGVLPPEVAEGVRQALVTLPAAEWEKTGAKSSRDDSSYADSVVHRFAIAEVERNAVLLGAARVLARMLPGTLPNFAAARYERSDRIAPHDDLVPEEYSKSEVRNLKAVYGNSSLASAAKRWRQAADASGGASGTDSGDALAKAMEKGDIAAVQKALAAAGAADARAEPSLPYTRWVAVAYYLSKDWKSAFGGEFVDLEAKNRHVPEFNTLVAFQVPRRHEVAAVKAPPGNARLSIFGWWLVEGSSPHGAQARPGKDAVRRKPAAVRSKAPAAKKRAKRK